jgi:hypothetical protein
LKSYHFGDRDKCFTQPPTAEPSGNTLFTEQAATDVPEFRGYAHSIAQNETFGGSRYAVPKIALERS